MPYQESPPLPPEIHVKVYRGDTWTIEVNHTEDVGDVSDAWLQIRDPDTFTLYADVRLSSDPDQWNEDLDEVTLLPGDTNTFTRGGVYAYDVQFIIDGETKTVQRGRFELTRDVTTDLVSPTVVTPSYTLPQHIYDALVNADSPTGLNVFLTETAVYHQAVFPADGVLGTGVRALGLVNAFPFDLTITKVYLRVNTAPTGAAIIVDILKNGASIFTDAAHRPQIAAAATTGQTIAIDVPTWAQNQYLQLSIVQVGSGTPGSDLSVHIVGRRA